LERSAASHAEETSRMTNLLSRLVDRALMLITGEFPALSATDFRRNGPAIGAVHRPVQLTEVGQKLTYFLMHIPFLFAVLCQQDSQVRNIFSSKNQFRICKFDHIKKLMKRL
jgi:hypothetical protein